MTVQNAHIIARSSIRISNSSSFLYIDNFGRLLHLNEDFVKPLLLEHHDRDMYQILSTEDQLFCLNHNSIKRSKLDQIVWKASTPIKLVSLFNIDSNSKITSSNCSETHIYCGSSTGQLYSWDISQANPRHTEVPLRDSSITSCMSISDMNCIVTATREGVIQFHDLRCAAKKLDEFNPNTISELRRPYLGSWISVLDHDKTSPSWLTFGGASNLCIFNIRMMKYSAILTPESELSAKFWYPQAAKFVIYNGDSMVIAGGNSNIIYGWSPSGKPKIQCSLPEEGRSSICHINCIDTCPNDDVYIAGASSAIHKITKPGCEHYEFPICI